MSYWRLAEIIHVKRFDQKHGLIVSVIAWSKKYGICSMFRTKNVYHCLQQKCFYQIKMFLLYCQIFNQISNPKYLNLTHAYQKRNYYSDFCWHLERKQHFMSILYMRFIFVNIKTSFSNPHADPRWSIRMGISERFVLDSI